MNPLHEVSASEDEGSDCTHEGLDGDISEQLENFLIQSESLSATSNNHVEDKVTDSLPTKNRFYHDLPATKLSELMKPSSLQNASTRSLLNVVRTILDENIEKTNSSIPMHVASLLKFIMHEIEERVSIKSESMRKQISLNKSREERYESKIMSLETLVVGTTEENKIIMNQLQQMKTEKASVEEEKKLEHQNVIRLLREKENCEIQISSMMQELDLTKKTYEDNIVQLKSQYNETITEQKRKIMELECILADSMKKVKELEHFSESKYMGLKRKELAYKHFMDSHIDSIQDLRKTSDSIRQDMLQTKRFYVEELHHFELELKGLVDAAQSYRTVLEENRRLYNEVQHLKGNIRVYCRIRPFLPGQRKKQTTVDSIGENGELVVANPLKQGKDTHRMFKFNKVFGPATTQEDVFRDTQPLIRSVLDGYNVCIFAYGQTGSGKTYTMIGPNSSSEENWGVNYRALNDLFNISQSRKSSIAYDVGVQMVEIYNEQVRDLLSNGSSQKRYPSYYVYLDLHTLGICNTTQPNGLAVPDASMHEVKSTTDVLELMNVGLMNRAIGATALNERSSRSHSVLTIHVQGTDLETNVVLHGNLHLVDLAGSERVDRSEVTGDRLREAQHINKSLSALGDVIFALAQKSPHVPYRNSKLTQLLQSSLGGQAKTLMFVQLNPDVESYSETVSTLKFAERVSGVELGAAINNKEGKGVRELMEQLAFLKDAVSRKDEEIAHLRHLKTNLRGEKRITNMTRYGPPPSPRRDSLGAARQLRRTSSERSSNIIEKQASDLENSSDCSDRLSEAGSQQSTDELKHHKEFLQQSRLAVLDVDQNVSKELESRSPLADQSVNLNDDMDLLRFEDGDDEERLSDISDNVLSRGTETDGSNSIVEYTLFPESPKPPPESLEKPRVPSKIPRPSQKPVLNGSSGPALNRSTSRVSSSKKPTIGSSSAVRSSKRWQ
ncbi:microtubule binding motor protein [Lithospermum erythrorhizon]|uniref:Microtubule binding motor protein n=1 Tax=Lithospermum erythrorhizon TaxID=34254 RepID=A0AAV3PQR3_LITER